MQNGIDIVIPIYNGYEDVQMCMDSIKKYTDLKKNRILLINDCSPDERILPYLQSIVEENIVLISNERNMGFSANVNKGMRYSDRDVILLNSDTIVTKNWVEKIVACAYREAEIGTVTPLSNSATLCSIPIMCQDNPIPDNCTIDELADIVEKYSLKKYPRITVAVGFCMFIKREVINLVGTFDAETYERGYGEENDFCNRAEQYGYKHVMCDDTFIYHKGTASFNTEEKRKLCEAHDRILQERYPMQMRKNHIYCVTNPDQDIRDNINLQLKFKNGRSNILYVLQSDFRQEGTDHIGGTQFHVKDLTQGLRDGYNIFVLAREGKYMRLTGYLGEAEYVFLFYVGEKSLFPVFTDGCLKKLYDDILVYFNIQMIHIHHTMNHSFDLYEVAEKYKIPVLFTVHDYYYVCPNVKLYDHEGKFCAHLGKKDCASCLKNTMGIAKQVPYIAYWREKCRSVLKKCRKIIFPSEAARNIVLGFYPELKDKTTVIEHGSDIEISTIEEGMLIENSAQVKFYLDAIFGDAEYENITKGWVYLEGVDNSNLKKYLYVRNEEGKEVVIPAESEIREDVCQVLGENPWYKNCGFWLNVVKSKFPEGRLYVSAAVEKDGKILKGTEEIEITNFQENRQEKTFRVAFLGGLVPAKGSSVALDMIRQNASGIEWYVFGQIGDAELSQYCASNLHKIGPYRREEIGDLLKEYQIDLVCILPKWAETFCYTLSEAVLNSIPVLVFDIGAVGPRVQNAGYGWSIPVDTEVPQIVALIEMIKNAPNLYQEKKRMITESSVKNKQKMIEEYSILYKNEVGEKPEGNGIFDAKKMLKARVY